MSDPQRLLDDPDASPLARSLLSSAAGDGPSPERRSAVAKKLGLAALLATTTSTSTEAGVVAGALWLKLGALLAVLGGIAALVVFVPRGSSDEPPAAPPVLSVAPAPRVAKPAAPAPAVTPPPPPVVVEAAPPPAPPAAPRPADVARPRVKAPPPVEPAPVPPPDPAPTVEAPPPPPPVAEAPVTVDPRRLAAEVAVLDRARVALRGNDVAGALAALDEHDRDFADGALGTAAEVVRIEALIQRGDRATAAERARTFLTSHPKSPLAKRVHSLLDSVEAARKEQP